jgi:hypothetical protein
MPLLKGPSTSLRRLDCPHCKLREQCLGRSAKGNRARRISAVRRFLPSPSSVEQNPHLLQSIRWVDVAGRVLRRTWTAHWRRQYVEILPVAQAQQEDKPPPRPLARSVRITAGVGRIGSHAMLGGDHRVCALLSLAFPLFSQSSNTGGTSKQRDDFSEASSSL